MAVSHSHIRTKKLQQVNLQKRRLWWEEGKKWVNIKISTKALKSIQKVGLDKFAKLNGVDLKKF
jgi:large subunit ribosomal protein L28